MCLELITAKVKSKIAKKDIICYKRLEYLSDIDKSIIKDGDEFIGVINNVECSGKISIESNKIYFCTNHPLLDGTDSKNKYGYSNSWVFEKFTRVITSIIINNKEVVNLKIVTPYRHFPIEVGKTYDSKLIKKDEYVHQGLHSYKNLDEAKNSHAKLYAECIIPKGSTYYEGKFVDYDSYASDKLTYVKIIKDVQNRII